MTDQAELAQHQREQLEKYLKWVRDEGGEEGPVRLDTYMTPEQQDRIGWLQDRVRGRVLEAGCSWGYVLACVEGDVGLDSSPKLCHLAQTLNPAKQFDCGDIRQLPYDDNSFGTVILAEVLEHIPFNEVFLALEEAVRVARLRLLITIPDGRTPSAEATSLKHQWLLTNAEVAAMGRWFNAHGLSYDCVIAGVFAKWEVYV